MFLTTDFSIILNHSYGTNAKTLKIQDMSNLNKVDDSFYSPFSKEWLPCFSKDKYLFLGFDPFIT